MNCTLMIKFSIPNAILISFLINSQKGVKMVYIHSNNRKLVGQNKKKNLDKDSNLSIDPVIPYLNMMQKSILPLIVILQTIILYRNR